jgi:hypothetical protein
MRASRSQSSAGAPRYDAAVSRTSFARLPPLAAALCLLGLVCAPASGAASTAEGAELTSICKEAALRQPLVLKAHFGLYSTREHPRTTEPVAFVRYRVKKVPPVCREAYETVIQVKVSYKASRLPWKTMKEYDGHRWGTWKSFFPYPYASRTENGEYGGTGWYYEFGHVTAVRGRARVLLVDTSTHQTLAGRPLGKLPISFTARRKFR